MRQRCHRNIALSLCLFKYMNTDSHPAFPRACWIERSNAFCQHSLSTSLQADSLTCVISISMVSAFRNTSSGIIISHSDLQDQPNFRIRINMSKAMMSSSSIYESMITYHFQHSLRMILLFACLSLFMVTCFPPLVEPVEPNRKTSPFSYLPIHRKLTQH